MCRVKDILKELELMKAIGAPEHHPYTVKLKREMRRLQKKDTSYADGCNIFMVEDSGIDGHTMKAFLPERISSYESAEEFFMNELYSKCMPSMYDCTSQKFTAWWHIGKLAGRYVVYYRECWDV